MIKQAKHGTIESMQKQIASMKKDLERKEATERRSTSGTSRSNELIRDIWAIRAEIEVLENWIQRAQ